MADEIINSIKNNGMNNKIINNIPMAPIPGMGEPSILPQT